LNAPIETLAWLDDESLIVSGWDMEAFKVLATSGKLTRLPAVPGMSSISIDRKGNRLAFGRNPAIADIWSFDLKDQSELKLISSTRFDKDPSYSPKGQQIAFASDRFGRSEIFRCERNGLDVTRLTTLEAGDTGSPRWSPDGRRIAFDSQAGGRWNIWIIDVNGGTPYQFTHHEMSDVRPSWSNDGEWIYFGSNREKFWQVWKKSVSGGEPIRVTREGGFEAFESANSEFLYYTKSYTDPAGLWSVPVGGGPEVLISDEVQQGDWALLKDSVYYVDSAGLLKKLNLKTNEVSLLGDLTSLAVHWLSGFSVHPDGDSILFQRFDQSETDLMLLENFN
jgi:dipeptidyl aminopeptidase/acylaminoacyl peptidase